GECLRPPRHGHRGRLPRHLNQLQRDHLRGRGGRGLQPEHQCRGGAAPGARRFRLAALGPSQFLPHREPAMSAHYSRRNALRLGGLSAAGLTLAACGVQGAAKQQTTAQAETAAQKFWKAQKATGAATFANWALYIDPSHQTLKDFTKATGIKVTY